VASHIEAKKQEIAQNLIAPQEEVEQEQQEQQDPEVENT
jgi:hypothetical protein